MNTAAKILLWISMFILGLFQIKYMYANILNNKTCKGMNIIDSMEFEKKAMKLNPHNPVYNANLGYLYFQLDSNRYIKESILNFEIALNKSNRDYIFLLNLGFLYYVKGDMDKAKSCFVEIKDKIDDFYSLIFLGYIYENSNDFDSAKKFYTQSLLVSPNIARSYFYDDLRSRNKKLADDSLFTAIEVLKKEYEKNGDLIIASKLASLLFDNNCLEDAEKILNSTLVKLPSLSKAWCNLGRVYLAKKDSSKAFVSFRRAILMDPLDNESRYYLSKLKNETNKHKTILNNREELMLTLNRCTYKSKLNKTIVISMFEKYFSIRY